MEKNLKLTYWKCAEKLAWALGVASIGKRLTRKRQHRWGQNNCRSEPQVRNQPDSRTSLLYEEEYPVYVYILTSFQEKDFKDTNPYRHYTVNDKYFFEELSDILGKGIYEKYDPQKVSADERPNMYI